VADVVTVNSLALIRAAGALGMVCFAVAPVINDYTSASAISRAVTQDELLHSVVESLLISMADHRKEPGDMPVLDKLAQRVQSDAKGLQAAAQPKGTCTWVAHTCG